MSRGCRAVRLQHKAVGVIVTCAALVSGCGGGPLVDRKDTVRSVKVTLHFGHGVVEALELPAEFGPLEAAGKDVTYTIAERGTCKRVLGFLSSARPKSAAAGPDRPAIGEVVVRTGWGKVVRLTWFGSRFEMDRRHLESSQLSKVLAAAIKDAGPRGRRRKATQPASRPAP